MATTSKKTEEKKTTRKTASAKKTTTKKSTKKETAKKSTEFKLSSDEKKMIQSYRKCNETMQAIIATVIDKAANGLDLDFLGQFKNFLGQHQMILE